MADSQTEAEELATRGGELARVGDFGRATSLLEAALRGLRGARSEMASRAYGDLGSLYAIGGRRFESILVWRCALDIAREHGLQRLTGRHLANLCGAYAALGLWDVLAAHLADCDAYLESVPEGERRLGAEPFLWPRVYLALYAGDVHAARTLFSDVQEAYAGHADPATIALSLAMKAEVQRAEGEADKALATLAAADRLAGLPPLDRFYVVCRTVAHLQSAERIEDARTRAPEALAELEALGEEELLGEVDIRQVLDVARLLRDAPDGTAPSRKAFEIATSITTGRRAAIDAALERIPALCELAECDTEWLAAQREDYRTLQSELSEG